MMIMLTLLFRWRVMERPREFVISRRFCIPGFSYIPCQSGFPTEKGHLLVNQRFI